MPRFEPHGEHVLRQIDAAPRQVKEAFLNVLHELAENPYPAPGNSVLPFKDKERELPNSFTAVFEGGLLLYQVMKDYPVLRLIQVTFLS